MTYIFRPLLAVMLLCLFASSEYVAIAQQREVSVSNRRDTVDTRRSSADETFRPPTGISVADYIFGPGDVLSIAIVDSPEMSGVFQVGETGYIVLPLMGQIKAAGLNGIQLTQSISEKLKSAELVSDPIVNVAVEEYHSRTVLVLGAVSRPAAYPLERPTTLLDIISIAGGLAPNAGNAVTITHKREPTEASSSIVTVDLTRLVHGTDPVGNIPVQAGDVVNVSLAPVVYVVGAVNKPGGFVIQDPSSGVTIVQAVALAEGLQPIANAKHGLIIRRAEDGKPRQEILVNLTHILKQHGDDPSLHPNDILFIPDSGSKKTLTAMAHVAEAGVAGIATYGLGLRVANHP